MLITLSSLNQSIIQKTVDSIIRVVESGQAWLEPDVGDSESDGQLKVMIFCRYLGLQIVLNLLQKSCQSGP